MHFISHKELFIYYTKQILNNMMLAYLRGVEDNIIPLTLLKIELLSVIIPEYNFKYKKNYISPSPSAAGIIEPFLLQIS